MIRREQRDYIIYAPHVDDEVIGCFDYLKRRWVRNVIYTHELTPERKREAYDCSARFDFEPIFDPEFKFEIPHDINVVLIPNIADCHPHHKQVNRTVGGRVSEQGVGMPYALYYSVDMNVKMNVLSPDVAAQKKQALFDLFPSQRRLFEQDDKYWLFESCLETDWVEMVVKNDGLHTTVWVRPT